MKTGKRPFTTLVSLLFSLLVIVYIVWRTDWTAVQDTFASLNWVWLLLALFVFLINYVLRTIRFQLLLYSQHIPFYHLLSVISLYGMYNYLLPAKSGEISYPILLKQRLSIPLSESVSTLVVARFFDFAAIALFLPVVLILFWQDLPAWLTISSLIFSAIMYTATAAGRWLLRRTVTSSFVPTMAENGSWVAKLRHTLQNVLVGLRLIDEKDCYWQLLSLTIGIWLCVYTNFFLIVLSMGYLMGYIQIIVVSIMMVPLTLLPFQGVANLGTHEVGWVTAFRLFGYSETAALNIAVGSHAILLLFVLCLGAGGFLLGQISPKQVTDEKIG
ncbi:MAG: flippase-like domain-containing protein [Ardenticatenaceae bacterium]|nr:flippase-like domain-containing protein [Anaerolineales bacterium]MCB8920233.1 flippase-like domain-containing protein [Ardenticatenaceae bacterium]MCB8991966.1 flippase-like domain-containing protein [Ardenticatenaceae bacterium]MCB9004905.1 flippase-like domain-containing protein [Ardenticatenaceae bacterium]